MELLSALGVLALFSILSFWQGSQPMSVVLWLLTAAISVFTGFLFFDKYADYAGVTFGLVLFAFGVFCVAHAYQGIIRGHETED